MASFFWKGIASRVLNGSSGVGSPLLLVGSASAASTSLAVSLCENPHDGKGRPLSLKKRMTSVGRFSLLSETPGNPSVPTFVALMRGKPLTKTDFCQLWKDKGVGERHPRFHSVVSKDKKHYEQDSVQVEDVVTETVYPISKDDMKFRLQTFLSTPFPVNESLWQMRLGTLHPPIMPEKYGHYSSFLMFRAHHCLADGVSLTAAFADLMDEGTEFREKVKKFLDDRRKKLRSKSLTLWDKIKRRLQMALWFCMSSLQVFAYQLQISILHMLQETNPFDLLQRYYEDGKNDTMISRRSLSWRQATTLEEAKQVARFFGPKVTLNDVFVSCVCAAVARQAQEHRNTSLAFTTSGLPKNDSHPKLGRLPYLQIAIPTHLSGGVLLPGESVGNRIGAFCARLVGEDENLSPRARLEKVHDTLYRIKRTPAAFWGFVLAQMGSKVPASWSSWFYRRMNSQMTVAISNVRGPEKALHMDGRTVEAFIGFLPLPPNVPIGVVVHSYKGEVILSVNAEPWAVPDADKFLTWVTEEYQRLRKEALQQQNSKQ